MNRIVAIIIVINVTSFSGVCWLAHHYRDSNSLLQQNKDAAETITRNVLTTVNLINIITEANQHAKKQITLNASRVAADIKVATTDDDCTNRPVPAGAPERLRQYADSLCAGASGNSPREPDSGNSAARITKGHYCRTIA